MNHHWKSMFRGKPQHLKRSVLICAIQLRLKRETGSNSQHHDRSGKLSETRLGAVSCLAPPSPKQKSKDTNVNDEQGPERHPPLRSPAGVGLRQGPLQTAQWVVPSGPAPPRRLLPAPAPGRRRRLLQVRVRRPVPGPLSAPARVPPTTRSRGPRAAPSADPGRSERACAASLCPPSPSRPPPRPHPRARGSRRRRLGGEGRADAGWGAARPLREGLGSSVSSGPAPGRRLHARPGCKVTRPEQVGWWAAARGAREPLRGAERPLRAVTLVTAASGWQRVGAWEAGWDRAECKVQLSGQ